MHSKVDSADVPIGLLRVLQGFRIIVTRRSKDLA